MLRIVVAAGVALVASPAGAAPLDAGAVAMAEAEVAAAINRGELVEASRRLDFVCDGLSPQSAPYTSSGTFERDAYGRPVRPGPSDARRATPRDPLAGRLAVLSRRTAIVLARAGHHERAFSAQLCTLSALEDKRPVVDEIERHLTRWLKEDEADALELRRVLGRSSWLVAERVRERAAIRSELWCIDSFKRAGQIDICDRMFAPLGGTRRSPVGHTGGTNSAIMSAARSDLGLEPTLAASTALDAMATRHERRWADRSLGISARWIRGLALLAKGDDVAARAALLDADVSSYRRAKWFAQLLLVRSRLRRDRGQLADATADSTLAAAATRDPIAVLEHAENLRASGRLHDAQRLLERARSKQQCRTAATSIEDDVVRAGFLHVLRGNLAGFADDLRRCRRARPADAVAVLARAETECARCDDSERAAFAKARVAITKASAALQKGGDTWACDEVGRALAVAVPQDSDAASIENDLGITYYALGRFEDALTALDTAECFAKRSPGRVRVLANLAGVLFTMGRADEATQAMSRALQLGDRTTTPPHVRVALEANVGKLALARGDLVAAQKHFAAALATVGTTDQILRAEVLDDVAIAEDLAGRHEPAERTFREALALRETLGADHPSIATSLSHLATLAWARGTPRQALPMFQRMLALEEDHLVRLLVWGSEAAKRDALARIADRVDWLVTYDLGVLANDDQATQLAFSSIVSRQGRALDAAARTHGALFAHAPASATQPLAELRRVNERIVWITLHGLRDAGTAKQRIDELDQLRTQARQLETKLQAELGTLDRAAVSGFEGAAELARRLLPGQALIDYVVYRPFHPERVTNRYDAARYAAYVVTREGRIRHVDLGPAAHIDAAIAKWRTALSTRADDAALAHELHKLVFEPLVAMLGDARDLQVVADSSLNLVPFDALHAGGSRLLERYRFTMLTSARDLAMLGGPRSTEGMVVFANPEFDKAPSRAPASTGLLDGVEFAPLPGTEAEARGIARAFPDAKLLLANEATGEAFKALTSPRIVHVATHGFFIGSESSERAGTRGLVRISRDELPPPHSEVSALLRSGLAFAHANRRDPGTIVAGLELARIDLTGTRLVTLSACESGLGQTASGDGVYGIRRALYLSGSETQVLSLWDVDDEATSELMVHFYSNLQRGISRGQALREAKALLASSPRFAHPYFWAAFILSGSENKLDGSPPEPIAIAPAISRPAAPPAVGRAPRGCGCTSGGDSTWAIAMLVMFGLAFRRCEDSRQRGRTRGEPKLSWHVTGEAGTSSRRRRDRC